MPCFTTSCLYNININIIDYTCILDHVGKYFLVDAGYANRRGFIRPYRGTHYHFKEYGAQSLAPRTPSKPFNFRHSKLRNVIERTFGLWKERFPILTSIPRNYHFKIQVKIVNACAMLHNFIMMTNPSSDKLYRRHHQELLNHENNNDDNDVDGESKSQYAHRLRDAIVEEMWSATTNKRC